MRIKSSNEKQQIFDQIKMYKEFFPFQRAFSEVEDLIIRNDLYSGIWCDYSADLVEGVVWDLDLVMAGLSKLNISKDSEIIVDLCCGEGRLARHIGGHSYSIKGIDYSEDQIIRAKILDTTQIVGEESWIITDLLESNSLKAASSNWDRITAVTSAASVNCFISYDQLSSFLRNIRTSLGKNGARYLLLPVFDAEAIPYFEKSFRGNILCHPFKSQTNKDILAWISLLYDKESKFLLQPSIAAVNDSKDGLNYEFVFSQDRIWTTNEVESAAINVGWNKIFSLPSNVISGGADQWPFTLLVFKNQS